MNESSLKNSQAIYRSCYRGRQSLIHHISYMRISKVFALFHILNRNGIALNNKKILDYGFGAGTFFRYCPKNSELFGLEIDSVNVEDVSAMLSKRGFKFINLSKIDIEHWEEHPLIQRDYDVVICSHVIEHLLHPSLFLSRVSRCIRKNGYFVGLVPINELIKNHHHHQVFDRDTLIDLINQAGLELLDYIEIDSLGYWLQPVSTYVTGPMHKLSQALSLGFGVAVNAMGEIGWLTVSNLLSSIGMAKNSQAAFVLFRP